jgi:hypothetical protein
MLGITGRGSWVGKPGNPDRVNKLEVEVQGYET